MPNKPETKSSISLNNVLTNDKTASLEPFTSDDNNTALTTNQGLKISDNQNSLRAGERGPTLLEDFIMREKITHFDHERIPERVVHARGEAAHGYFELYESQHKHSKAGFLNDTSRKTPVFVRFSTVAGSRGSADTVRDVRGFAVKFYTEEGVYDLVGNNIPIFFIQDAIKFPDLIHAVKPEPHNEIPQAASAHDTFWDFVSLTPESMHMMMWAMSDRAIPRSLRMMEGFGVHTFRLVNKENKACFVKFHWKPILGIHSLVWDEAQKLAGKDGDFHRLDLWQAIDKGNYPEWELGVQIVNEEDEHSFDFDLLDPTKIIPEELVPVKIIGKMTLDRNPDNFFAETEQVAFHPGNIVPGIDFTNDPLLQGRLFSYTDTQISRLGGANFHEIPINRPLCPFHNNQRDGMHRQTINKGKTAYQPNSLSNDSPREVPVEEGGFSSYTERVDGNKIRVRSKSFSDHFSQAALFWNSQSDTEKEHIVAAFQFELSKLETPIIRQRIVDLLSNINGELATKVAAKLDVVKPSGKLVNFNTKIQVSPALSMANTRYNTIQSRTIAVLVEDGANKDEIESIKASLNDKWADVKIIGPHLGNVTSSDGSEIKIDQAIKTAASVIFDAVFIPSGSHAAKLANSGDFCPFRTGSL